METIGRVNESQAPVSETLAAGFLERIGAAGCRGERTVVDLVFIEPSLRVPSALLKFWAKGVLLFGRGFLMVKDFVAAKGPTAVGSDVQHSTPHLHCAA